MSEGIAVEVAEAAKPVTFP